MKAAALRLFFVNRYFHPDHSATSQMLSDLVFALARRGHRITVVTSRLGYEDPLARYPRRETISGVDIVRVATTRFGRAGLAGRAVDYVTFYLATAWALLLEVRRGDVIIAKTDPPLLGLVTMPVARLRGARQVNWLQDIFPEVAIELGMGRALPWRILFSTLRRWRDRVLRKAALNVVIGDRMADVVRRLGVLPERIRVIPNWADGEVVRPVPAETNGLRHAWGLDDTFVVGYSGNLGRAHDIETMIDAMALTEAGMAGQIGALRVGALPVQQPTSVKAITWLFVGGGAKMGALRDEAGRRQHARVQFHPYQPRAQLAESLSVPDVHLITLQPALEGLIVPSKYYGIAAAGRPAIFVGDPDGEIARILTRTQTGFVVAAGDSEGLARIILSLARDPHLAIEYGRRARALLERTHDLPFAVAAWEDAISQLSPEGRAEAKP